MLHTYIFNKINSPVTHVFRGTLHLNPQFATLKNYPSLFPLQTRFSSLTYLFYTARTLQELFPSPSSKNDILALLLPKSPFVGTQFQEVALPIVV